MGWLKRLFCKHRTTELVGSSTYINYDDWGNADEYLLTEHRCTKCGYITLVSTFVKYLHDINGNT